MAFITCRIDDALFKSQWRQRRCPSLLLHLPPQFLTPLLASLLTEPSLILTARLLFHFLLNGFTTRHSICGKVFVCSPGSCSRVPCHARGRYRSLVGLAYAVIPNIGPCRTVKPIYAGCQPRAELPESRYYRCSDNTKTACSCTAEPV